MHCKRVSESVLRDCLKRVPSKSVLQGVFCNSVLAKISHKSIFKGRLHEFFFFKSVPQERFAGVSQKRIKSSVSNYGSTIKARFASVTTAPKPRHSNQEYFRFRNYGAANTAHQQKHSFASATRWLKLKKCHQVTIEFHPFTRLALGFINVYLVLVYDDFWSIWVWFRLAFGFI